MNVLTPIYLTFAALFGALIIFNLAHGGPAAGTVDTVHTRSYMIIEGNPYEVAGVEYRIHRDRCMRLVNEAFLDSRIDGEEVKTSFVLCMSSSYEKQARYEAQLMMKKAEDKL